MLDIFNNNVDTSYPLDESSFTDQNMEPNMPMPQKEPIQESISAPNEHHMHHAHMQPPATQTAHDLHQMHQNVDAMKSHGMHEIHSMQTVHDMQTTHNMHKMHEGHEMSMNGSHSMDSFGRFLNTTDMNPAREHDMSGHEMSGHGHGGHMEYMSHGSMGHGGSHSMTFHGGIMETILFSWWNVKTTPEFIGSFVAVFAVALLYEGLKYYRKHLLWKTYSGLRYCAVAPPDKGVSNICATDEPQVLQPIPHTVPRNVPTMLSGSHVWQTLLHGIQVFVSYLLMLIFMTYNTWLCSAVVLGSATGYFLFGWRESVVVDFTEHCH